MDIGVLGYIGIVQHKEHSPELFHIPPGTHSQEECARLWENAPYVKVHRYNPKHLYPKLNGYGDNGKRSLKYDSCYTLIIKFILKLAEICGFCNVNICT